MSNEHVPDPAAPATPAGAATPPAPALWRRALAEGLGTALLVAVVVGSGIMAQQLSSDVGLQLLQNSLATFFGLTVLILLFQQVSGSHFNPAVTLVERIVGGMDRTGDAAAYIGAQIVGGLAGAVLANAMFSAPTTWSTTDRATSATVLAEVVATAGLVLVILALVRTGRAAIVAPAVGAYIGAAYWFTSSTSFANPAVTIGRMITDTFAGIAPASVLPYIGAQLIGAALAVVIASALFPRTASPTA
ncbi:aquaporin [Demequina zhanjiangensis]|uniref:MIP/aquaporin family protein n=1 Tax=Demequina zhanjiangensis TaxID=3051659 RepID=A0ABT8FYU4_9MICO|nr:MIP/aquaporin family protein [Demequina sp. SYSU T00b26]MDN4472060.1 MIP/aquaporin family protein [Demequina sp. SYSU T00b26]